MNIGDSHAFINDLHLYGLIFCPAADGFNNAIITNIDVFTRKKVVCFYLVTDLAYSSFCE